MSIQIHTNLPFDHLASGGAFHSQDALIRVVNAVEQNGFAGVNVTDHPSPGARWLDAGGHHAQDPFVMLSLVAAVSRTLRLQTGILVLPYRNPFLTARAVASLDVFSGGRVSLGVGAGYQKAEFLALGVDFEQRNTLFDEYLQALKAAWVNDEFSFQGQGYQAHGNRIQPRPLQQPHPPLLIGGNAPRAIRRACDYGDFWFPFLTGPALNKTSRTRAMGSVEDLQEGIAYMRDYCTQIGRTQPPGLAMGSVVVPGEQLSSAALVERIREIESLGFSQCSIAVRGDTVAQWCDDAARVADEVIARL